MLGWMEPLWMPVQDTTQHLTQFNTWLCSDFGLYLRGSGMLGQTAWRISISISMEDLAQAFQASIEERSASIITLSEINFHPNFFEVSIDGFNGGGEAAGSGAVALVVVIQFPPWDIVLELSCYIEVLSQVCLEFFPTLESILIAFPLVFTLGQGLCSFRFL